MTTLTNQDLFNYLNNLTQEIIKLKSSTQEGSLEYLSHSTLIDILDSEQRFIKQIYPKESQMLSFSSKGFPSTESLFADLNSMSELNGYDNITNGFNKDYFIDNGISEKAGPLAKMKNITKEEYEKEKQKISNKPTITKTSFGIRESESMLELGLREDLHLNNPDNLSIQYPILVSTRNTRYQGLLGRIFEEGAENHYFLDSSIMTKDQLRELEDSDKDLDKQPRRSLLSTFKSPLLYFKSSLLLISLSIGGGYYSYYGNDEEYIKLGNETKNYEYKLAIHKENINQNNKEKMLSPEDILKINSELKDLNYKQACIAVKNLSLLFCSFCTLMGSIYLGSKGIRKTKESLRLYREIKDLNKIKKLENKK